MTGICPAAVFGLGDAGGCGICGAAPARPGTALDNGGSLGTRGGPFDPLCRRVPGAGRARCLCPLSRRCGACAGRGLPGTRVIHRAGLPDDLQVVRRLDHEAARWGIGTYR